MTKKKSVANNFLAKESTKSRYFVVTLIFIVLSVFMILLFIFGMTVHHRHITISSKNDVTKYDKKLAQFESIKQFSRFIKTKKGSSINTYQTSIKLDTKDTKNLSLVDPTQVKVDGKIENPTSWGFRWSPSTNMRSRYYSIPLPNKSLYYIQVSYDPDTGSVYSFSTNTNGAKYNHKQQAIDNSTEIIIKEIQNQLKTHNYEPTKIVKMRYNLKEQLINQNER